MSDISAEQIDDYKDDRLADSVQSSTINRDLRVLRRMLRVAERRKLIPRNSSVEFEFLKQQPPRLPHIVTFEEEEKLPADRGALFTCVDRPHSGDRHALS